MNVSTLDSKEYDSYTAYYLELVPAGGLIDLMERYRDFCQEFFTKIPAGKWNYRYAPDKWTVKEVFQHMIDTERIFAYRALRFARHDTTSLPGFEVDDYAAPAKVERRSSKAMIQEYQLIKSANILLFKSFDEEMLLRKGMASGHEISVRALGFKLIGHEIHHMNVLVERYLD